MVEPASFAKLVPGFDFLQGLAKGAGAAMPGIGQWVAPTLDPEELDKRIEELRTVQFWLEQNARMLSATIQALEVQRMTLSTLKTMNVRMGDLRDAMMPPLPQAGASADAGAAARADAPRATPAKKPEPAAATKAAPGAVDPMQWWNALTRQFTELAGTALKDGAGGIARGLAAAPGPATQAATPRKSALAPRKAAPRKRT